MFINLYKCIKLKVIENQMDRIIQTDVVRKSFPGGEGVGGSESALLLMTNKVKFSDC